jgi:four helix bundle protein
MAQSFRDLLVWQKAMQLALAIYKLSQGFPNEERFGLTSQLRRCAVSIPSNIAEGQGRLNKGEFINFLGIARGSNFELQTQLELARALQFGKPELLEDADAKACEVGKMLHGLLESLRSPQDKSHTSSN